MLFMESYMCYCSVRLGVIIVAVLAIVSDYKCSSFQIVSSLYPSRFELLLRV